MRSLRMIGSRSLLWSVCLPVCESTSAKDDAAGLAITERMKAEVSGLEMATRNANDAISMLETAEGSTREIASALQRMRELAVVKRLLAPTQIQTGWHSISSLVSCVLEMQRIATQTTWNTMTVLNGGNDLQTAACYKDRGKYPAW